jgi:hypothetical protein
MSATALWERMTAAGFALELEDGRIFVSPANRITDAIRSEVRAHRDELAALLGSVEREAADLIERLHQADPDRWTQADIDEARRSVRCDYPAGITCLRALTGTKR